MLKFMKEIHMAHFSLIVKNSNFIHIRPPILPWSLPIYIYRFDMIIKRW